MAVERPWSARPSARAEGHGSSGPHRRLHTGHGLRLYSGRHPISQTLSRFNVSDLLGTLMEQEFYLEHWGC